MYQLVSIRIERFETKGIEVISLDTEHKLSDLKPDGVERSETEGIEVNSPDTEQKLSDMKLEGAEVISLDTKQKVSDLKTEGVERSETEGTEVISQDTQPQISDVADVEDSPNKAETEETQPYFDDNVKFDGPRSARIELSLCGNLLRPGMGISTATETFNTHLKIDDKYFTWDKAAHIVLGMAAYGLQMPIDPNDSIPVEDSGLPSTPSRRWRLWPIPFRRVKTLDHNTSNLSGEDVFLDSESVFDSPQAVETTPTSSASPKKQFVRTQTPTTEQISSLNLKEGQNMVSFIFSTRVLGVQKVDAHIYLWKWNARIVISDVDGTITKSDVLGQFMSLDGKALTDGPVVISPDGLFPSLFREVIRRAPHEFKIACLEDIKALFPFDYNPFYAGFGNRDTDELSYRKIGIPKGKIFIINAKGEVAISHLMDMKGKSYTSLHTLVNDMFPPTSMIEQEDFNSWNYWRVSLTDVK
ncbi:hypothetical protein L2E82_28415 [Cichorium intybus]|uniref:Uncharacterized protein n=1 Tax=Cichorium intybus TaxID=13427 RepID=A0ACB9CVV5_CICIN|nr:hypothetical protein L2E82_28415 [Cichorium intybus]